MRENNILLDDIDIVETIKSHFLKLLCTLKNEMNSHFNDIKNLSNALI